jgi:hypothetical protein
MIAALNLDVEYLCVDRCCINQADPDEKHAIVRNMDHLYRNATFIVIASAGLYLQYGLPGINGTSRPDLSGDATFVTAPCLYRLTDVFSMRL